LFVREDWKMFRNIETLPQKAGVNIDKLGLLVAKELADNALDISGRCEVEALENNGFYIKDNGNGINLDILPELFSFNRPLVSSKLLRLPTRGALGNGLRVVVGAVAATDGQIFVSTKGKRHRMIIQPDGRTLAEIIGDYNEEGTLIEVYLGKSIKADLSWAQDAIKYSNGDYYKGKTSGHWYTSESFYELLQGHSHDGNLRDIINQFDGCTGTKVGLILKDFKHRKSNSLSFEESDILLKYIRENSKQVNPNRLGQIGEIDGYGYYKSTGNFNLNTAKGDHNAEIPFVVEAWVNYSQRKALTVLVNKTPITGEMRLPESKNKISIYGCGIYEDLGIKKAEVILNIITPYMPITSDGKAPDMIKYVTEIVESIQKSGKRAKKLVSIIGTKALSQKEIITNNLEEAVQKASGDGKYRFSQRQLFYAIRPYVITSLGKEPEYNYFCTVITEYEAEHGDIDLMYRDNRGTLYHPHIEQDIPVGTVSVENYNRPKWTFNKVLYIEKEGFFNILKDNKIPEKYDMALLTSKGYASRAVKDLLDSMADADEEITFFCIHDADAAGTKIFETLQEETKARPGRKVNIINLGLEPEEALSMCLEVEKVDKSNRDKAVAYYVEQKWKEWLQSNRVELNAMSTPQFLGWLERKIQFYDKGKVIPPTSLMIENLDSNIKGILGKIISDDILQQNGYDEKLNRTFEQVKKRYSDDQFDLKEIVEAGLKSKPTDIWRDVIENVSDEVIANNFKNCDF